MLLKKKVGHGAAASLSDAFHIKFSIHTFSFDSFAEDLIMKLFFHHLMAHDVLYADTVLQCLGK